MRTLDLSFSDNIINNEFEIIKKGKYNGYETSYHWNNIVLKFQWKEFYKKEIELWNQNKLYKGLPLQSWIYLNRMKYIGKNATNLTDREILRAFKIAGIYIGNSFHSPFYIQQFIKDYSIKSIYDSCGGWGHRMLGAVAVGCEYSYNDINPITYENCIQMQKFLGFSTYVYNNDAACFTPSEYYEAVFTCPPYFNVEKYSEFGAENLSYSGFLNWWKQTIIKSCIEKDTCKYFAFIINHTLKLDMENICLELGLRKINEIILGKQNYSHLNSKSRIDGKKGEFLLVFTKN